jgi:hemoglobin
VRVRYPVVHNTHRGQPEDAGRALRVPTTRDLLRNMTNHDIETRADIDELMNAFYAKAMTDPVIGHFFTEVVRLDLDHHLPIIGDFWESLLLGGPAYRNRGRSPLEVHAELDQKERLQTPHFHRWLELFSTTVDELFEGPRAGFAKMRGAMIARRMIEYIASARPPAVE